MPLFEVNIHVVADSADDLEKLLEKTSFVDSYDEIMEEVVEPESDDLDD